MKTSGEGAGTPKAQSGKELVVSLDEMALQSVLMQQLAEVKRDAVLAQNLAEEVDKASLELLDALADLVNAPPSAEVKKNPKNQLTINAAMIDIQEQVKQLQSVSNQGDLSAEGQMEAALPQLRGVLELVGKLSDHLDTLGLRTNILELSGALRNRLELEEKRYIKSHLFKELQTLDKELRGGDKTPQRQTLDKIIDLALFNKGKGFLKSGKGELRYSVDAVGGALGGLADDQHFQQSVLGKQYKQVQQVTDAFKDLLQTKANQANMKYYLSERVGKNTGRVEALLSFASKDIKAKQDKLAGLSEEILGKINAKQDIGAEVSKYILAASERRSLGLFDKNKSTAEKLSANTASLAGLIKLANAKQPGLESLAVSINQVLKIQRNEQGVFPPLTSKSFQGFLDSKLDMAQVLSNAALSSPANTLIDSIRGVKSSSQVRDPLEMSRKAQITRAVDDIKQLADPAQSSRRSSKEINQSVDKFLKAIAMVPANPLTYNYNNEPSANRFDPNYVAFSTKGPAVKAAIQILNNPHNKEFADVVRSALRMQDGVPFTPKLLEGRLDVFRKSVNLKEIGTHLTKDPDKQQKLNVAFDVLMHFATKDNHHKDDVSEALDSFLKIASTRRDIMGLSNKEAQLGDKISNKTSSVDAFIKLLESNAPLRRSMGIGDEVKSDIKLRVNRVAREDAARSLEAKLKGELKQKYDPQQKKHAGRIEAKEAQVRAAKAARVAMTVEKAVKKFKAPIEERKAQSQSQDQLAGQQQQSPKPSRRLVPLLGEGFFDGPETPFASPTAQSPASRRGSFDATDATMNAHRLKLGEEMAEAALGRGGSEAGTPDRGSSLAYSQARSLLGTGGLAGLASPAQSPRGSVSSISSPTGSTASISSLEELAGANSPGNSSPNGGQNAPDSPQSASSWVVKSAVGLYNRWRGNNSPDSVGSSSHNLQDRENLQAFGNALVANGAKVVIGDDIGSPGAKGLAAKPSKVNEQGNGR